MRGRKPVPNEIKERTGTNDGHRLAPPAVVGDPADPLVGMHAPEYLPAEAVEVWNEIVPALVEVGLARSVDYPALEALTTHVAIARNALTRLMSDGRLDLGAFVDYTDKGVPVVSPYHRIYRDSWREALKLAEHYGLTPISRTRLGIAALQQRSLAEQLKSIMDEDGGGDESTQTVDVFDAPTCLGCGVEKGRKHRPECRRPGFSELRALDPGEVVAGG